MKITLTIKKENTDENIGIDFGTEIYEIRGTEVFIEKVEKLLRKMAKKLSNNKSIKK